MGIEAAVVRPDDGESEKIEKRCLTAFGKERWRARMFYASSADQCANLGL